MIVHGQHQPRFLPASWNREHRGCCVYVMRVRCGGPVIDNTTINQNVDPREGSLSERGNNPRASTRASRQIAPCKARTKAMNTAAMDTAYSARPLNRRSFAFTFLTLSPLSFRRKLDASVATVLSSSSRTTTALCLLSEHPPSSCSLWDFQQSLRRSSGVAARRQLTATAEMTPWIRETRDTERRRCGR